MAALNTTKNFHLKKCILGLPVFRATRLDPLPAETYDGKRTSGMVQGFLFFGPFSIPSLLQEPSCGHRSKRNRLALR
jgi:hypothetical protein